MTAKKDHIVKRGGKFVLLSKSTGEVLGTHATREGAEAQERAIQASKHSDVAPPGREEQVKALKGKPGIDNPYAVAWASYNKDDEIGGRMPGGDSYDGAKCDGCGQMVPVRDGVYVDHLVPGGSYGEPTMSGTNLDAAAGKGMCSGSGGTTLYAASPQQGGGMYRVVDKRSGAILSSHNTHEAAVRALPDDDDYPDDVPDVEKGLDRADGRVRRFVHVDFSSEDLPRAEETADGFWKVAGRVARTGIQEYRDGAGNTRRELRLPEEVKLSVPQFALQPLTNDHPPKMVNPQNAKEYVVGAVGQAVFDGKWIKAPMTIYRGDAIQAVKAGRAQLSVGYTCRLEARGGEWEGQRYDAVQRDIVVNHVALVDRARAGDAARLRLDAADAIGALACDTNPHLPSNLETENAMNYELKIGGMVFKCDSPNAQAAVDQAIAAAKTAAEAQTADAKREAANEKARADGLVKERDGLQGKLDAKDAEEKQPVRLDGKEIPVGDATDPAKMAAFAQPIIEERAAARASLLVEARKHLGANEKFDAHKGKDGKDVPAKSDVEIKRLVVQKLDPSAKLDGRSDDYVQARYDAAIEKATKAAPATGANAVRQAVAAPAAEPAPRADDAPKSGDSAHKAMVDRMLRANPKHPKHDAAHAAKV